MRLKGSNNKVQLRLRRPAKKRPVVTSLMPRARAAVRVLNSIQVPREAAELEMRAFLSIFHPGLPAETVRKLTAEARDKA